MITTTTRKLPFVNEHIKEKHHMQISGDVETLNFLLVLQKIKRKLVRIKIIAKPFHCCQ